MTRREYVRVGSAPASLLATVTPPHTRTAGSTRRGEFGFTLIELLVGLVIIGVLLGAVALAFPDTAERRSELAADRALALLQLACERSELTGREVGVAVARQALVFLQHDGLRWSALPDSPAEALRPRRFGDGVGFELRVDGRTVGLADAAPAQPQLFCQSSGESTPFELEVGVVAGSRWQVSGDGEGGYAKVRVDAR